MIKKLLIIGLTIILCLSFETTVHKASWYGGSFHGKKTASGEIYNKNDLTCASTNVFKIGTMLEVTNVSNNKKVIVKVNDRGGFAKFGRTLDLSEAAFKQIANLKQGVVKIKIKIKKL